MNEAIALGRVHSLCVKGEPVPRLYFNPGGPLGDNHSGFLRKLSGHDRGYLRTSELKKGGEVLNVRSWTGLSYEEIEKIEKELRVNIPQGCLFENIVVAGIPNFSQLVPTSRLVFPKKENGQLILVVWEENGPCDGVGSRLEEHHKLEGLSTRFIAVAQGKRGVMGMVYSEGLAEVGDLVRVYPPVR